MENYVVFSSCNIPSEIFSLLKETMDLPPQNIMEEQKKIINTPFSFEEKGDALILIKSILKDSSILILVDIKKECIYFYKGNSLNKIKDLYIPRFYKAFLFLFGCELPKITTIKDLRVPEETFALTNNALAN
jgi:hypothetical protein